MLLSVIQKQCLCEGDNSMKKEKANLSHLILPVPMGDIRPCPIITDPQGCYTGRPLEVNEQPVQDADDL